MPLQAPGNIDGKADPAMAATDLNADQRRNVAKFGIGFDGRDYRYRDYRYERLSDALNYAELESSRSGWQAANAPPQWLAPHQPSEAEQAHMAQCAVTFDGRFYLYEGYRYERCIDALNYAKSKMPD